MEFILLILTGSAYGLAGGFSPGPTTTLVVAQSLRYGVLEGVKVAIAPALTDAPIIFVSVLFVSQMARFSAALGLISLAGAAFLLHLAVESFRIKGVSAIGLEDRPKSIRRGFFANLLNPHPFLFWFTVGARELLEAWQAHWLHAFAFLLGLYVCLIGAKVLVAWLVAKTRGFLQSRGYLVVNRLLGLVMLVFAGRFAWDAFRLLGSVGEQPRIL